MLTLRRPRARHVFGRPVEDYLDECGYLAGAALADHYRRAVILRRAVRAWRTACAHSRAPVRARVEPLLPRQRVSSDVAGFVAREPSGAHARSPVPCAVASSTPDFAERWYLRRLMASCLRRWSARVVAVRHLYQSALARTEARWAAAVYRTMRVEHAVRRFERARAFVAKSAAFAAWRRAFAERAVERARKRTTLRLVLIEWRAVARRETATVSLRTRVCAAELRRALCAWRSAACARVAKRARLSLAVEHHRRALMRRALVLGFAKWALTQRNRRRLSVMSHALRTRRAFALLFVRIAPPAHSASVLQPPPLLPARVPAVPAPALRALQPSPPAERPMPAPAGPSLSFSDPPAPAHNLPPPSPPARRAHASPASASPVARHSPLPSPPSPPTLLPAPTVDVEPSVATEAGVFSGTLPPTLLGDFQTGDRAHVAAVARLVATEPIDVGVPHQPEVVSRTCAAVQGTGGVHFFDREVLAAEGDAHSGGNRVHGAPPANGASDVKGKRCDEREPVERATGKASRIIRAVAASSERPSAAQLAAMKRLRLRRVHESAQSRPVAHDGGAADITDVGVRVPTVSDAHSTPESAGSSAVALGVAHTGSDKDAVQCARPVSAADTVAVASVPPLVAAEAPLPERGTSGGVPLRALAVAHAPVECHDALTKGEAVSARPLHASIKRPLATPSNWPATAKPLTKAAQAKALSKPTIAKAPPRSTLVAPQRSALSVPLKPDARAAVHSRAVVAHGRGSSALMFRASAGVAAASAPARLSAPLLKSALRRPGTAPLARKQVSFGSDVADPTPDAPVEKDDVAVCVEGPVHDVGFGGETLV